MCPVNTPTHPFSLKLVDTQHILTQADGTQRGELFNHSCDHRQSITVILTTRAVLSPGFKSTYRHSRKESKRSDHQSAKVIPFNSAQENVNPLYPLMGTPGLVSLSTDERCEAGRHPATAPCPLPGGDGITYSAKERVPSAGRHGLQPRRGSICSTPRGTRTRPETGAGESHHSPEGGGEGLREQGVQGREPETAAGAAAGSTGVSRSRSGQHETQQAEAEGKKETTPAGRGSSAQSGRPSTLSGEASALSVEERNGTPLQCSCPESPVDRGAWWAAVRGVAQSRTRLKRLSSSSAICRPADEVRLTDDPGSSPYFKPAE